MVSINSGTTGSIGARTLVATNATLPLGIFGYHPYWVWVSWSLSSGTLFLSGYCSRSVVFSFVL
jgi:hypothetical protein